MLEEKNYFPEGTLGEKKRSIYAGIEGAEFGGLERKSVLRAMDKYAWEYYYEKMKEAWERIH